MREELDAFTQVNCDRQVVLAPVSDFPGDRLFGLRGEVTTWELAFWSHSLAPFIFDIGGHGRSFRELFQGTRIRIPGDSK